MAAILIVEDDGLIAGHLSRILRQAGHTPILVPDAHSALQEASGRPDVVLLDLGLPDLPGEQVLARLRSQPETAKIPVIIVTGRREATGHLKSWCERGRVAIMLKPVSAAQLGAAVEAALACEEEMDQDALRVAQQRQRGLILRLIVEGPDSLAIHVSRRLCADRVRRRTQTSANPLTWADIGEWGKREGLLDAEEASLLRRIPSCDQRQVRGGTV
ncbi:MAG TPA: response regulator [Candidatus Methylomirabilis sp.]|nr:response regulator [Candidatus Methylomirabilis sp.]